MSTPIIVNGVEYLLYETVERIAPIFCRGSKRASMLIDRQKIDKPNYNFIKGKKNNNWELHNEEVKPGRYVKLAFKKEYIDKLPEVLAQKNSINDANDNGIPQQQYQYAPDIVRLDDNEKFKDADGNIIDIETRGERKHDKIYFRVKDVAAGFGMENLERSIDRDTSAYIHKEDYDYFIRRSFSNCVKVSDNKRELFLTYTGILRVLFASHSKNVRQFIKWATETLFTMQMGTKRQKRTLASTILGIDAQTIKDVFDTDANSLPCVYLFSLGYVRDLRTDMNIDAKYADDSVVCKYGYTKELSRRTAEHMKTFDAIRCAELRLKHYAHVDPQYLSKAETNIRTLMTTIDAAFKYQDMEELVILPQHLLKYVEEQYGSIAKNYMGHCAELITRLKDIESKHMYELSQERHKNDMLTETHKNELLNKDIEIMRVKLEYFEKK